MRKIETHLNLFQTHFIGMGLTLTCHNVWCCLCVLRTFRLTSANKSQRLMTLKESADLYYAFLLAGDVWFSQNPFLVATVRFSLEKIRLDDVEESSFSKDFSEHF